MNKKESIVLFDEFAADAISVSYFSWDTEWWSIDR